MDDIDIEGLCIIQHPLFLVCAVRFFFICIYELSDNEYWWTNTNTKRVKQNLSMLKQKKNHPVKNGKLD